MPWCHSCNSEFRDGITQCPTCNIPLDAAPAEVPDEVDDDSLLDGEDELAVVGRADFATCLEMRKLLHDASIPCAIVREEIGPDATPEQQHHPKFDLLLPVARLEDATRVLAARGDKMLENEGLSPVAIASGTDSEHCPACGFAISAEVKECPDCGLAIGA